MWKWLKKVFCWHEWVLLNDYIDGTEHVEIYQCPKCGKIKRTSYYRWY